VQCPWYVPSVYSAMTGLNDRMIYWIANTILLQVADRAGELQEFFSFSSALAVISL
jgi:hypothetical protein